jgi:hypothetical protein
VHSIALMNRETMDAVDNIPQRIFFLFISISPDFIIL